MPGNQRGSLQDIGLTLIEVAKKAEEAGIDDGKAKEIIDALGEIVESAIVSEKYDLYLTYDHDHSGY